MTIQGMAHLLLRSPWETRMPLLNLLGFARLWCGCLVARYRGQPTGRDVDYVEERGYGCVCADHRLNQPLPVAPRTTTEHRSVPASAAS